MYKFFKHTVVGYDYQIPSETQVKFRFRLLFDNAEGYEVLGNTGDPGIDLVLNLKWSGMESYDICYHHSIAKVQKVARDAYAQVTDPSIGTNKKVMTIVINGINSLDPGSFISMTPSVSTATEVGSVGETVTYNIP